MHHPPLGGRPPPAAAHSRNLPINLQQVNDALRQALLAQDHVQLGVPGKYLARFGITWQQATSMHNQDTK
jgi:hypothetical protein